MNRLSKTVLYIFILFYTQAGALSLVDIKGVMLQRISSFISWPQLPDSAMKVCVVGDEVFAKRLQKLYKNKELHGRSLNVISVDSTTDKQKLLSCQIIYIADDSKNVVTKIAQTLKNNTTLIIGSDSENIYDGASIVLYLEGNRYKIIINEKSLANTNLKADYRLLKLAKIVKNNRGNNEVK
ncbi:YfiR family protein [Sulfurimonas sp.]